MVLFCLGLLSCCFCFRLFSSSLAGLPRHICRVMFSCLRGLVFVCFGVGSRVVSVSLLSLLCRLQIVTFVRFSEVYITDWPGIRTKRQTRGEGTTRFTSNHMCGQGVKSIDIKVTHCIYLAHTFVFLKPCIRKSPECISWHGDTMPVKHM